MLDAAGLVDDQFTLQDGMLAYLWSRMTTIDEIKDYSKYESLTFIDMLEALGIIADMKALPLGSDLAAADINILEWQLAKQSGTQLADAQTSPDKMYPHILHGLANSCCC